MIGAFRDQDSNGVPTDRLTDKRFVEADGFEQNIKIFGYSHIKLIKSPYLRRRDSVPFEPNGTAFYFRTYSGPVSEC